MTFTVDTPTTTCSPASSRKPPRATTRWAASRRWSRASALSFLDDAGIDVAITSISARGVHTGGDAAARLLARRCNELAAELIRDRPARSAAWPAYRCRTSTARRPNSPTPSTTSS